MAKDRKVASVLSFKTYRVQLVTWLWNVGIVKDHANEKGNIMEHRNGTCNKYQRATYRQQSYDQKTEQQITLLNNEGVGVS